MDTETIGRYRLLERIGEGGMGVVYRAWDTDLDRLVAVKIVRGGAGDDEGRERLLREGRAIARLHHPAVVKVHEVGIADGRIFLAMELVRGATLREWLDPGGRDWREVLPMMIEAGEGLAAAHDAGLVHRDFKPANVLTCESPSGVDRNRVKVADFGLARSIAGPAPEPARPDLAATSSSTLDSVTRMGTLVGTPAYMAPEQHLGEPAGPRADQFAFCVVLWEAIHGARPFIGASRQELMSNVARGRTTPTRRAVPRWLRRVIARGLRADPERRHPSMHALLRELRRRPQIARWSRIALVSAGAVALAGAIGFRETLQRRRACAGQAAALVEGWSEARHADVAARLEPAAAAGRTVVRALDEQARALELAARARCEAAEVRGEANDPAARCLAEHAADLESMIAAIEQADAAMLARAVDAITGLGTPARCADGKWAHGDGLAPARTLVAFARFDEAERALSDSVVGEHAAEALLLRGIAEAGRGDATRASASLRAAIWAAEADVDDGVGATAWVELVRAGAASDRSERDALLAEHAIVRAGGDPTLALVLAATLAERALAGGRAQEAVQRLVDVPAGTDAVQGEILAARALALRGQAQLAAGHREAAASDLVRALAMTSELFGGDDPRAHEVRVALDAALAGS